MDERREIQQQLALLRARYASNLDTRIAQLNANINALETLPDSDSKLEEIFRQLHSLSGSAGTFGFHRISEQSRQLELILKQHASKRTRLDSKAVDYLKHGLSNLQQLASQGADDVAAANTATAPAAVHTNKTRQVFVVEHEPLAGQALCQQLEQHGFDARLFTSLSEVMRTPAQSLPDAMVIDMALPATHQAHTFFTDDFLQSPVASVPRIFISSCTDWETRLTAVRCGAAAFLEKPVDAALLLMQLDRITHHVAQAPGRILVVDDSYELAQHYALVLRTAHLQTEVLTEPSAILDTMHSFKPDLVLLDYYFPGISGLEIARVLRQHATYFSTPVIFLSTEIDRDIQMQTLQQGDDFLEKPVLDDHLVSAVTARIERMRALS
ncbi:MAG: response regulator [Gammaproteobacteria bacterium]